MKIVIAGGTGFIGQKLVESLFEKDHYLIILTRKQRKNTDSITYVKWLTEDSSPELEIREADVFINLAGVSINNGNWNKSHQKQIYDSRIQATKELLRIIQQMPSKPTALINASAIGIYPASTNELYTEDSLKRANDF